MAAEKESWGKQLALFVPVVTGLVASAILLVDYVRPAPVFCDATEGCARLKHTMYASFLHLPTPAWGILGFVAIGVLALLNGPRVRTVLATAATIGALVAAVLLSVQAGAGVWCKFCCVVDASALVLCGVAWWKKVAAWDAPRTSMTRASFGGAMLAALALPIAIGATRSAILPGVIAKELASGPADRVTIVDFVDFECPFCRITNAELEPLLESHAPQLHVVRRQVPLERLHPHALDAARAACCGETMGKGDAMANALFEAPVDDLTEDGCAKLALSLGLDENAFRACMQDPAVDARIRAETEEFKQSQSRGLPTIWIGEEKIEGAVPGETLNEAITRAIAKRS